VILSTEKQDGHPEEKMKECVELVLFYMEEIVVYIHLQQTPICCHLPRLWPAQPIQLVVDS